MLTAGRSGWIVGLGDSGTTYEFILADCPTANGCLPTANG
jgi:hypothetical protein